MKTVIFALVALSTISISAFAQGEYDRRSDLEYRQRHAGEKTLKQQQLEEFARNNQRITDCLAQINQTPVRFYPHVRDYNSHGFEDVTEGEWRLGNGGVCVHTVFSGKVLCKGAQGFEVLNTSCDFGGGERAW